MFFLLRRFFLVVWLLWVCAPIAWAGSYVDPSGFSFTYPDDWVPISSADLREDALQKMPSEMKEWLSKNNFDFKRIAVVVVRTGHNHVFSENFNVVVTDQEVPIDDVNVKKIAGMLEQEYAKMGLKAGTFHVRVQTIGSRKTMVTEYQLQMPGVPDAMRQKQVFFPSGGKTYIATCCAKTDSFDQYVPVFDQFLATFDVPAPVSRGLDWTQVIASGATAAVASGVVGWIATKKKKAKASSSVEQ